MPPLPIHTKSLPLFQQWPREPATVPVPWMRSPFHPRREARTKKVDLQLKSIKEKESKKEMIMKSGKNLTSSSACAPAMETTTTAAPSEGADASTPSHGKNCCVRQVIYVRSVCPTCSVTYTTGMNAPDMERYFGRVIYRSSYSCKDCHHTFDVDLEWPADGASSSSRTAEPATTSLVVLLADEGGKKVAPGSNDEPANFVAPPVCGECSSEHTWFLRSMQLWKKRTSRRCVRCSVVD
jgi:hypothetical protein